MPARILYIMHTYIKGKGATPDAIDYQSNEKLSARHGLSPLELSHRTFETLQAIPKPLGYSPELDRSVDKDAPLRTENSVLFSVSVSALINIHCV